MVEAVEEGRFELNFYGALAWARSRARVHARSLELSSMPRPERLAVTLFGSKFFGGGRGKISKLRGRFGTESVAERYSEGRKVSLRLLIYSRGTIFISKPEKFYPVVISYTLFESQYNSERMRRGRILWLLLLRVSLYREKGKPPPFDSQTSHNHRTKEQFPLE